MASTYNEGFRDGRSAGRADIVKDENIFTATDQQEREIIWSALCDYRQNYPESTEIISDMILRVSQTFAWARES